jgi:hypothetical protein
MIFKCGNEIHFVEWKAMTLPVKNQDSVMQREKRMDNLRQLCKSYAKFHGTPVLQQQNLKTKFWSAFLYIDFDDNLINYGIKAPNIKFDRHGNFQKYKDISINNSGRTLMKSPLLSLAAQGTFVGSVNLKFELKDFTNQITNANLALSSKNKLLINNKDWDSPSKNHKNLFDSVFNSAFDSDLINLLHTSPETSPTNNPAPR